MIYVGGAGCGVDRHTERRRERVAESKSVAACNHDVVGGLTGLGVIDPAAVFDDEHPTIAQSVLDGEQLRSQTFQKERLRLVLNLPFGAGGELVDRDLAVEAAELVGSQLARRQTSKPYLGQSPGVETGLDFPVPWTIPAQDHAAAFGLGAGGQPPAASKSPGAGRQPAGPEAGQWNLRHRSVFAPQHGGGNPTVRQLMSPSDAMVSSTPTAERTSVLFVCLGNICRSPLAEGIFRELVARAGESDRFRIDSAGTGSWHVGSPPDARSVQVAAQHGLDLESTARQVAAEDFAGFDCIVAMDRDNLRELRRLGARHDTDARIFLLREHDPTGGLDVPDPYYGGSNGFERVYRMIERSCRGLLQELRERLPNRSN